MTEIKRKPRGLGKKPALQYVAVRLDKHVIEYYDSFPSRSAKMREVLSDYLKQHGEANEEKSK
jgi:hypothetical protein